VQSLLQLDPRVRPAADAALKAHAFFQQCEAPLDFASLTTTPPPPLVPPLPPPQVTADSVINAQLAARQLEPADRRELIGLQAHTPWTAVVREGEVIVLATPVLKRRHFSVKRRQLLLCDCVDGGCRLFYVDAERKMELKGTVPWSDEINAELMPRGCFRIRVPGRTYYLEDAQGSAEMAELWVRTLLKMRARLSKRSAPSGGGDAAPMPPRNGPTREPGSRRAWPQVALPHWLSG
jgi:hypothetical protein